MKDTTILHCIVRECNASTSWPRAETACTHCGVLLPTSDLHFVPSKLNVHRTPDYNPDWTSMPHNSHHLLCDACLDFHQRQHIKFQLLYDGTKDEW